MKKTLPNKKDGPIHHYYKSTIYSLEGLISYFLEERSFRLYIGCAFFVVILGIVLQISLKDWILVGLVLVSILAVELLNTALESAVDLITKDFHPLAKRAKDLGSAATFVMVVFGIVVACILFIPYFK